ncbi:methyltransferase domain-containing protein [Haloferacaceae archaeon DSL9]
MIDRDAVRSNAKYLRNVRPIDPDEIAEYIEGYPHPAAVRQTLREEAVDLGLVERDDGTFVPVDEEPVSPRGWSPDAFPDAYAFALEDLLVRAHGANWHVGESGRRLRAAIRRLKADYYHGNDVEYDETAALGYAIYHLPDYYAVVGYVLEALTANGLLSRRLRVLDVGAGAGGPALGLHDYLHEDVSGRNPEANETSSRAALVDYHAVEPSAAADVLSHVLEGTDRNFHATIHRTTAERFDYGAAAGDDPFDLVVFGNVLSELDDPVSVVEDARAALAADGSILALAPADLNTSTGLRGIERTLAPVDGDLTVYAPTLRLWDGHAPSDRGWSFDVGPDLAVPPFQRRLDEGARETTGGDGGAEPGTFVNVDVQFSYSILRADGARRFDLRANPERHAKMAEMERHVTERINLLAVKLSHDLSEEGNPLFKIGDGSEAVEHYAVVTKDSLLNRDLQEAPYGAILEFENVLALWNDDEAAYNLVVDGETIVDLVVA